jgi:hypothetical protein
MSSVHERYGRDAEYGQSPAYGVDHYLPEIYAQHSQIDRLSQILNQVERIDRPRPPFYDLEDAYECVRMINQNSRHISFLNQRLSLYSPEQVYPLINRIDRLAQTRQMYETTQQVIDRRKMYSAIDTSKSSEEQTRPPSPKSQKRICPCNTINSTLQSVFLFCTAFLR